MQRDETQTTVAEARMAAGRHYFPPDKVGGRRAWWTDEEQWAHYERTRPSDANIIARWISVPITTRRSIAVR